jgi:hypothetical protein
MPIVVQKFLKWCELARAHLWIVVGLGSAVVTAIAVQSAGPPLQFTGGQLSVASAFAYAWATLARLTPMDAKPHGKVEKADQWTFWGLFWIGTYLATAAAL